MTLHRRSTRRPAAFTLVELLTVVGIISMLIAILLPSLSRARTQAKKVKTAAIFSGIDKALEMFQNDFRGYPDSSRGFDPITYEGVILPAAASHTSNNPERALSGAHWLARALAGHDRLGIDVAGLTMTHRQADGTLTEGALANVGRKGVYMEGGELFARDSDIRSGGSFEPTGRTVVVDTFDYPVLYYRANPRVRQAFAFRSPGDLEPGREVGIYNHYDNALITGCDSCSETGWDFAGVGGHKMAVFGTMILDESSSDFIGKFPGSFTYALHNHNAHESGNVIKPHNPETFILISPGPDGNYGTDDDVTNFKGAL